MQKEIKEKLGKELIGQIEEKIGSLDEWVSKKDGAYIPREVLDKEKDKWKDQVQTLEEKIKERDTSLDELKKKVEDGEDATEKIKELQDKNKESEKQYQEKLTKLQKRHAVKEALIKSEAINPELLVEQFDYDSINPVKGKDGEFTGIEEQVKNFKEEKFPSQFGKTVLEGDTPNLNVQNPETQTKIDELNKKYEEAQNKGNLKEQIIYRDQIFELEQQQKE